jgi:hypothetical protein
MSWTVGRHRVEIQPPRKPERGLIILVDHRDVLPLAAETKIKLGRIEALLRVTDDHGVLRPELWIGDQRVPASPDGTERLKAPPGMACQLHNALADPYRSSGQTHVAKYGCAGCKSMVCSACLAVDRALCRGCFDTALKEEDWLRDLHRRTRGLKIAVTAATVGALALVACLSWHLSWQAALAAVFTTGGSIGVAIYQRMRGGQRPRTVWASTPALPSLPPGFAVGLSRVSGVP